MSEELIIAAGDKKAKYESLIPQVKALLDGETNRIAKMANLVACLKQTFDFFWVGFYQVVEDELVLAPFQGPVACMRIRRGKGVCGTSWHERRTLVVPDVDLFPGHIACSSASRSEIVVPVYDGQELIAVLDVDSDTLNTFDEIDAYYLEELVKLI